jgi:hypothetical protein
MTTPEPVIVHDDRSAALLPSNDPRRIALQERVAKELAERAEEAAAARAAEIPPTSAQCRAALRVAVQKHADLTHRLTELTKAVPASDAAVMQARRNVEAAKEAAEKAKADAAAYASARALGTAGTAPPPLRNARLKLTDCEDQLEIAKAAAADLAKQHKETEQSLSSARWDVEGAVAAVVRADPATQKLIEVFKRACRELADLREAVELVAFHFPQMERLSLLSERIDDTPPCAKRREWEAALAALETNAETELPA